MLCLPLAGLAVAHIPHKGINAETALARANSKFEKRFRQVEIMAGGMPQDFTLEELDRFWERAKR